MDLIDRQAAIDAVRKLYILEPRINNDYAYNMAIDQADDALRELPSVDTDLSGFSDKLWKTAYERGKAEAQRWIPVSERLPNIDEVVLVYTTHGETTDGWRFDDDGWFINGGENCHTLRDILAWMPLPEPYKDGDENDNFSCKI